MLFTSKLSAKQSLTQQDQGAKAAPQVVHALTPALVDLQVPETDIGKDAYQ